MNYQPRPTAVYFDEPVEEFDGGQIYWRYRTGGYLPEDGGSYGRCATYTDANIIILKRKFAELKRESDARAEELNAWKALSDVSTNITPGDNGAIEIPPTPDSIRDHLKYLQEEWDGAERRLATVEAENTKLRKALAPSAETKAAYMGEFSFEIEEFDEDCELRTRKVEVPWTTIKEIMAAISRQALAGKDGE